jgi:hypothetical protein
MFKDTTSVYYEKHETHKCKFFVKTVGTYSNDCASKG